MPIQNGPCSDCMHLEPDVNKTRGGYCKKNQKIVSGLSDMCTGFEYKSEFITVDISRVDDNERFKSSYPASTDSDVIVSTSIDSIAAILGIEVSESSRKQIQQEVEKIKNHTVKKNDVEHSENRFNLGTITVQITKSWKY